MTWTGLDVSAPEEPLQDCPQVISASTPSSETTCLTHDVVTNADGSDMLSQRQ